MEKRFNIRVYGLIVNDKNELLISDEYRNGYAFTKFPGGGLEWGEGFKDTLKRELKEELNVDATVLDLFYITDFFQASAFRSDDQLISVYYFATFDGVNRLSFPHYTTPLTSTGEKFRWVKLEDLSEELMTFPIDKIVVARLITN